MKDAEKVTLWFCSKIVGGKLILRLCGYLCEIIDEQVLEKFGISDSTATIISQVVQIYLAGLAIANSFEKKKRLTAKELKSLCKLCEI